MLAKLLPNSVSDWKALTVRRCATPPVRKSTPAPAPAHDTSALLADAAHLRVKLAEMEASAEPRARQAYDSGFQAGEIEARQKLESEVRLSIERMAAAIAEVPQARAETIRRAESDTVRLAIEIARRVLHRELSTDSSALEALVKAAMEKLQGQEIYRVRVHPDQAAMIKSCLMQSGRGQNVEVIADPIQPKGGVVFEIAQGTLDASVETQLREIERGLADQLETRS
jgi:flagellar assembly protein FliH